MTKKHPDSTIIRVDGVDLEGHATTHDVEFVPIDDRNLNTRQRAEIFMSALAHWGITAQIIT